MSEIERYTEATSIRAETFNERGKWKYTVYLDYSETASIMHQPSGYINPVDAALLALTVATARDTSEVTFSRLPDGWFMFVPDPPNGWPIMARSA